MMCQCTSWPLADRQSIVIGCLALREGNFGGNHIVSRSSWQIIQNQIIGAHILLAQDLRAVACVEGQRYGSGARATKIDLSSIARGSKNAFHSGVCGAIKADSFASGADGAGIHGNGFIEAPTN